MDLSDFAERQPVLEPERFFAGELQGWGLEAGPLGGIGRRLQVTATGRFDEATQTLNLMETYRFDDGHIDRLEWRIRKLEDGRYEAHEARLVEPGSGEASGSAFHLTYRRAVPQTDGSTTTLSFDDWFVLIDEQTLMVRASIYKLMVPFGSLTVVYRRVADLSG
jgi:hypothetical protein